MARVSSDPLQPNPFTTYRDPQTGTWIVIKCQSVVETSAGNGLETSRPCKINERASAS